ncbi:hypothetical protein Nepgr_022418 [Nepenthes gracilis]|uniref:Uncharacterized protein n=1 Tax=Nepenthes gracilis TaxID=150966 RepID=A0AAD3XWS6_NEPGR|nr:hypothetical protein Nepgr_022418 [Nepenthes gracilis]
MRKSKSSCPHEQIWECGQQIKAQSPPRQSLAAILSLQQSPEQFPLLTLHSPVSLESLRSSPRYGAMRSIKLLTPGWEISIFAARLHPKDLDSVPVTLTLLINH